MHINQFDYSAHDGLNEEVIDVGPQILDESNEEVQTDDGRCLVGFEQAEKVLNDGRLIEDDLLVRT